MNTAENLLKPDDALADGHTLTEITGPDADRLVAGAPGCDPDNRETLTVSGDLLTTKNQAWSILTRWNETTPPLFKDSAGTHLLMIHDTDTGPVMKAHDIDTFRNLLVERIRFVKTKNGGAFDVNPDDKLIRTMLSSPPADLPTLSRIVTTPVLGPDFRMVSTPGYHGSGHVFYQPGAGFNLPRIPDTPSRDELAAAVELLSKPFAEFPFQDDASRTNLYAALLTPFVRDAIEGPTPLFLVSKAQRGTGGTLLCDVISTIATGQPASVIPPLKDDAELGKRITGNLTAGRPIMLLDNVNDLKGATLAAALTGRNWGGRLLYSNETVDVSPRCLWLANGNNPRTSGELTRRIVYIRMVASVADPAARQNFQIQDLIPWCEANRPALVAAILTMIRAWMAVGRPDGDADMASYESWSRIVGGVLKVAGVKGFLANRTDLNNDANDEDAAYCDLIEDWNEKYGSDAVGAQELIPFMQDRIDFGRVDDHGRVIKAGCLLSRLVGCIYNGFCIEAAGKSQHRKLYRLVDNRTDRQEAPGE